jgi:hypothetical protein
MARLVCLSTAVLFAVALTADAGEKKAPNTGLDKLKTLAGTWVAADKDGKPTDQVVSVFRVTAAGSAVHETLFPGTPHEMVTVYHLDGNDVVLTHYCAMGNQPRLKLDPESPKDELVFKFAGGTNLDPQKDRHMHEGSIKILDADHIQWSWQGYEDGKPAEQKMSMALVRKK